MSPSIPRSTLTRPRARLSTQFASPLWMRSAARLGCPRLCESWQKERCEHQSGRKRWFPLSLPPSTRTQRQARGTPLRLGGPFPTLSVSKALQARDCGLWTRGRACQSRPYFFFSAAVTRCSLSARRPRRASVAEALLFGPPLLLVPRSGVLARHVPPAARRGRWNTPRERANQGAGRVFRRGRPKADCASA